MLNSIFLFLNLGGGEVVMIVFVLLMLFGSDKLPDIAKTLGKGLREINDAKDQIQSEISKGTEGFAAEIKKHASDIQTELEKAGQGMQRQLGDLNKTINDEGKNLEDTMK